MMICLVLLGLIAACGMRAADPLLPSIHQMLELKNRYFESAVHPDTHLIYGRADLEIPDHWKRIVFPSPNTIREKTNADAEIPNVSNCALAGGLFLGQLADIYALTKDPETVAQARTLFGGLKSLAHASQRKGFVARCLLPGDPTKAHFLNSSVDQYTFFVYGLYKYYHSPMADEAEKHDMREMLRDICTMIERDGTILGTNGAPGWVSDIEAIRSDRSSRLLEVFLVGFDMTGDRHWREAYLEKVREAQYGRLRSQLDPMQIRFNYVPRDLKRGSDYADVNSLWQTQYSLVPLVELETDLPLKAAYLEAMRTGARIAERYGKQGIELQIIMLAQNRDIIGAMENGNDRDYFDTLTRRCAALLKTAPLFRTEMPKGDALAASVTHVGVPWVAAADTYWTGLVRKVIATDPYAH
jgi:hypothetical protein